MAVKGADLESELIDTVCERVRERLPAGQVAPCESFVRQYYQWVPAEDLADRNPLDLYGAGVAHWNLAQQRAPGESKVRVYNPDFEQHGWQSPHTLIEIVTDDMPFIVDSVTMQLGRLGYGIDLVIHPVIRVRRDAEGYITEVLDHDAAADDAHSRVGRARGGRARTRSRQARPAAQRIERVLSDVRAAVEDWQEMRSRRPGPDRGARPQSAAARRPRARRGDQGVPRVAERGQLHVPRLQGVRPDRRRGPGAAAADRGLGARDPPRRARQGAKDADRQGADRRSRAADHAPDQGQLRLSRPPARVPGLHRRQEVLRGRSGDRRAPLPRPVHDARVQGEPAVDPDHPRQGRRGAGAGRVPAGQPRPQGAARDPRVIHARLAVPDGDARVVRLGDRDPRLGRAPAAEAVPVAGPARAVRGVPGVHPAGPLQHREPGAGRQDSCSRRSVGWRSIGRCS